MDQNMSWGPIIKARTMQNRAGVILWSVSKTFYSQQKPKAAKPQPSNKTGEGRMSSFTAPQFHSGQLCIEARIWKRLRASWQPPLTSIRTSSTFKKTGDVISIVDVFLKDPAKAGSRREGYLQLSDSQRWAHTFIHSGQTFEQTGQRRSSLT